VSYRNRLVFLGNNAKTDFYQMVAEKVDRNQTRISWIVVNAAQRDMLLADYPADEVLYLPLSLPERRAPYPIKINDLVFADRRLKQIMPRGLNYLRAIQAPIVDFLGEDIPTLVVGELGHSYEVVAHRLLRHRLPHARWVSPFMTRVPPGRFAFFDDEAFSREAYENRLGASPEVDTEADEINYKEANQKHIVRQDSGGFILGKIGTFLSQEGYDPDDPTWYSNTRIDKIRKNVPWFVNRATYKWAPKVGLDAVEQCRGRKVIFPLHMQPELNIDTCGRYWDDQVDTIIKIWRQLGPDDMLFIKEHPVAIGNRGYWWYRRLLAYPNIKLLHHAVSVPRLLEMVDYVFTVSGTMGLEGGMLGRKVFCLAPTTYDRLETVVSPTIADFRSARDIDDLYERLLTQKAERWTPAEYLAFVLGRSFDGDPEGDIIGNPNSYRPANVALVARAFAHVLDQLSSAHGAGARNAAA
jgi:hypothetical protein